MGTPYLSEIRIMAFSWAPQGWALCNGQLLPINQNQALFSLLGTMYGGNGQTTFALPDMRGRIPIHIGSQSTQGQTGGQAAHTLTQSEMPAHPHVAKGTTDAANSPTPAGNLLATTDNTTFGNAYQGGSNLAPMAAGVITNTGGSQAHNNMAPYLTLNFCIALQGVFPSRT
jgi:microcystin-dependent protein